MAVMRNGLLLCSILRSNLQRSLIIFLGITPVHELLSKIN